MTLNRKHGRNPNLGFGMVPPNPKRANQFQTAARHVLDLLNGGEVQEYTLEAISEVKGLCNRVLREDQSDWVVVWLRLGLFSKVRLSWVSEDLVAWRLAFKEDRVADQSYIAERLQRAGLATALAYFVKDDEPPHEEGMGYLYLLSTRADRTLLKIGQTSRGVLQRVEEINRATGVPEPFSPRRIWRVRDPQQAERNVHALLGAYRTRSDREFFRLSLDEAAGHIEGYLRAIDGKFRLRGFVKRKFADRGYGFIQTEDLDYFFHATEARRPAFDQLSEGDLVSFDRIDTSFGLAAADIQTAR